MKSVIVTGTSKGIGAAIVKCLLMEGIHVIGIARNEHALKMISMEKIYRPGKFEYVAGSVTDEGVVLQAIQLSNSGDSNLIGAVLNAGVVDPIGKIADLDLERMKEAFQTNLLSNFMICKHLIPHLRKSHGSIIMLSSGIVQYPTVSISPYICAKTALNMLATVLALEEPEITVLAVRPGLVATDMVECLLENKERLGEDQRTFITENEALDPFIPAHKICEMVINPQKFKTFSGKDILYSDEP